MNKNKIGIIILIIIILGVTLSVFFVIFRSKNVTHKDSDLKTQPIVLPSPDTTNDVEIADYSCYLVSADEALPLPFVFSTVEFEGPSEVESKDTSPSVIPLEDAMSYTPGDSDYDKIPDSIEAATGTDPGDDDTDNDGLPDGGKYGEDVNSNGVVDPGETDPRDPDSDDDCIQDGAESGLRHSDAWHTDDAVFKSAVYETFISDPTNPDTDDDGYSDSEEINAGSHPSNPESVPGDVDGDKLVNADDNCPYVPNKEQTDTDSDGIGSACDNCVYIPNPEQTDRNNNGYGDICEPIERIRDLDDFQFYE